MVYIFLADGFEEIEALTVVDMLRRAGIEIKTASVKAETDVMGSHSIPVRADITLEDVEWDSADMLVFPGGMPGTRNLSECDELMKRLDERAAKNGDIAAICAAPALLFGDRGLLKGKKAICYPGMEDHLNGADVTYDTAVTDGNIITSRGLGTAIDFALAIITKLISGEKASEIAKSVVYG